MPVDVKKDDMGDVIAKLSSEGFKTDILTDRKYGKKMSDQENKHRESDVRMKFGKFYDKAKKAKKGYEVDNKKPFNVHRNTTYY